LIVDNFLGDTKSILFGVFDGHGGKLVVNFVIKNLPEV
jgi:serine/threonine protein phosphatase PrpC